MYLLVHLSFKYRSRGLKSQVVSDSNLLLSSIHCSCLMLNLNYMFEL